MTEWSNVLDCKSSALVATEVRILPGAPQINEPDVERRAILFVRTGGIRTAELMFFSRKTSELVPSPRGAMASREAKENPAPFTYQETLLK